MTMFHLVFPRKRGFLFWDELGCLARSLGFQEDIFQQHINYEIETHEDGLAVKQIVKMLDLKLLYRPLHRTFNMHTAGWNMAVIRKTLVLLDYHALGFEELHNIRVSYEMYEAIDMKGLYLDQHVLLRAIKMCGRFIAPMKLMHRIKHMKTAFDENGRIQLYEFLDLILWCDFYQNFSPGEMEYSEGKDNELFKLVNFERLLSHHDERVASQLNSQYLQEEWDFGHETLGSKLMFRDPPVKNEQRLQQTKFQKERYRHLKEEVDHSQQRVYRALAGYVRQRPISAPDLGMYSKRTASDVTTPTTAKQVYQSVQRRLKSAPSRGEDSSFLMDLTDRPQTQQYHREATPVAVSSQEKTEIDQKMEELNFAITTLDSRLEIHKEREMQAYIPSYLEKLANKLPPEPLPEPAPKPKKQGISEESVKRLAYPQPRLPPSHARKCDARFRGWYDVRTKTGSHYVLVASSLEPSPVGSQLQKMRERAAKEVPAHHSDYVYRYTRRSEVPPSWGLPGQDSRPITAPASMHAAVEPLELEEDWQHATNGMPVSAGVSSRVDLQLQRSESATVEHLMKMSNLFEAQLAGGGTNLLPETVSTGSRQLSQEDGEKSFSAEPLSVSTPLSKAPELKGVSLNEKPPLKGREEPVADVAGSAPSLVASSSKPKVVEVGQMGIITLLESIKEAETDEEVSTVTSMAVTEEKKFKPSRLALARDSVGGTPVERSVESTVETSETETESGTELTPSTSRITSAERKSILVRREGALTPYGYCPPRSPSPCKEKRSVKYDENSIRKGGVTLDEGDIAGGSTQTDTQESPDAKVVQQQFSPEDSSPRLKLEESDSPSSRVSQGWDSPTKQSPRNARVRIGEPFRFPKEANFPLDSIHLERKASPRASAKGRREAQVTSSAESATPESPKRAEENKKKMPSPKDRKNATIQNGQGTIPSSRSSFVSSAKLEANSRTPQSTPREVPREENAGEKAQDNTRKYDRFLKRYEKDLPPYLKNRLLTAGTS